MPADKRQRISIKFLKGTKDKAPFQGPLGRVSTANVRSSQPARTRAPTDAPAFPSRHGVASHGHIPQRQLNDDKSWLLNHDDSDQPLRNKPEPRDRQRAKQQVKEAQSSFH